MYNPTAIKLAMLEAGVETGKDLAEKAGVNINTIYAALRGEDLKVSTLEKIAQSLNRDEADFFVRKPSSKLLSPQEQAV